MDDSPSGLFTAMKSSFSKRISNMTQPRMFDF
jgi:hypothetical protein